MTSVVDGQGVFLTHEEFSDLTERVETLERVVDDWAPFVNQMRMTLAQFATNPMVLAMIPPQYRATIAQYAPPVDKV